MTVPYGSELAFPEGFKVTVRFSCDFDPLKASQRFMNVFCLGQNYDDVLVDEHNRREEKKGLLFVERGCRRPDWIGFCGSGDENSTCYLDEYTYEDKFKGR